MVEACRRPSARGVTELARLWEVLLHVIGIRRPLVILQVAGHACRVGEVVIVVDVAIRALPRRNCVQTGKWEAGLGMVEGRGLPRGRVVARLASLCEAQLNMVRICRSVEVLQVARYTGCAGQVVVVVCVAISALAWRHAVRTGERESRQRMVEPGIEPVIEAMAPIAACRKLAGHVIGIGC